MSWLGRMAALGTLVAGLAGCAGNDGHMLSILDPVCMPDGSVVWMQYPNSEGSYEGAVSDLENCPWNQAETKSQS